MIAGIIAVVSIFGASGLIAAAVQWVDDRI